MITNISTLRTWFLDNQKPFFTLYQNGVNRAIIARNETVDDLNQAWNLLETNVLAQAEGGTANVRVYVTEKPKHNHGLETEARILPLVPTLGQPGISGLPQGYLDESKVAGLIKEAREKWELERRIEELEMAQEPVKDWAETMINGFERVAKTPLGAALVQKLLGVVPMPQPAMNGVPTPAAQSQANNSTDDDEYSDSFFENIENTAALLGVDEETLANKLAKLVQQNPELAKSLLV